MKHRKPGPQHSYDNVFRAAWGDDWRARLDSCSDVNAWKAGKDDFVRQACAAWLLPRIEPAPRVTPPPRSPRETYTQDDVRKLPLPPRLNRDTWLHCNTLLPQLEFVVDSETLANVLNITRTEVVRSPRR